MAYATDTEIAAALGKAALTPAESASVALWEPAAEAWINAYCGTAWATGPLTGQAYRLTGGQLYLVHRPLVSVEAVSVGTWFTPLVRLLVAGTDYVVDLARGLLRFGWFAYGGSGGLGYGYGLYAGAGYWGYECATVDYTPVATVPAPVRQAAAQMLADALLVAQAGVGGNVVSYSVFGQVQVQYGAAPAGNADPMTLAVSPSVLSLLQPYRTPVLA